ncbi:MAG: ABC transporter permease [Lachnospiraceae bacterium]|nr:ABC transporter permease [Lachnospiraceae bacterium]
MSLVKTMLRNRDLIFSLAKNDFKTKFAGSYFGIMWAFVNPVVTVFLYWFVFGVVFKGARGNGDYPYVIYLVSGLVPWFLFQETLTMGTHAMLDYSYLVKKVVFKIEILPVVKLMASTFVHIFFVAFSLVLFGCMGYFSGVTVIQLLYYLVCLWAFVLALLYATSSIILFFRDLGQIITIFMQVFMWMVPILWNEAQFAAFPTVLFILKLNPMYYIVTGYRDAFIDGRWFFEKPVMSLYFWVVVIVLFMISKLIFKRLRPHFADVI